VLKKEHLGLVSAKKEITLTDEKAGKAGRSVSERKSSSLLLDNAPQPASFW